MHILTLLLIILSFAVWAQQGPQRKIENKIAHAEYAYEQGKLEEAASISNSALKQYAAITPKPFSYFELLRIKALADFHNARFSDFFETESSLKQEISKGGKEALFAHLALTSVYTGTGQTTKALDLAKKNADLSPTDLLKQDFDVLMAEVLYQQGFYSQSLAILSQEYLRKKITGNTDSSNHIYTQAKLNQRRHKIHYAKIKSLQIQNILAQGYVMSAKDSLNTYISWLKSDLSDSRRLLFEAYLILAAVFEQNNDQHNASKAYAQAVYHAGSGNRTPLKAYVLYKQASHQLFMGNRVNADAKIRELQIDAFQIAGIHEPVQPYYELTSITRTYMEGNTRKAMSSLEKLRSILHSIPEFHPFWKEYYQLTARLAYASSDISAYLNATSQLSRLISTNTGTNSATSVMASLNELMKTSNFTGFYQAEALDIATAIRQLDKEMNPEGAALARYYDIATEYYYAKGLIDSALYFSEKSLRFKPDLSNPQQLNSLTYRLKNALFRGLKGDIQAALSIVEQNEKDVLRCSKTYTDQALKSLLLLNQLYQLTEQKQKSVQLAGTIRNIRKPAQGLLNIPETIEADYALASIYAKSGNYYKAEKIIAESRKLAGKELPAGPFIFPLTLLESEIQLINGNYDAAENGILQAIRLSEKYFGPASLQLAKAKYQYAQYFDAIADYSNAKEELTKASTLFTNALGQSNSFSPDLFLLQAELGIRSKQNDKEITANYLKALEIALHSYQENSEKYNKILISYSDYLIRLQNYTEAGRLLDKALTYFQNTGNTKSLLYADVLRTRGKLSYARKEYASAEKEFSRAEAIIRDRLSREHPAYNTCLGELARTQYMQNHPDKAIAIMEETIPRYLKYIETLFPGMSFRQKSGYWAAFKDEFEFYNYLLLSVYANTKPAELGKVYNNIIATKAILLSSDKQIRQNIATSGDSVLIAMFEDWIAQKEFLGSMYGLSKAEQTELGITIEELEKNIEAKEKNIGLRSTYFADNSVKQKATWKDVRAQLQSSESVVEILRVRYFNHSFADSAFYAALVLNGNKDFPTYVKIPKAGDLEGRYYKYHRNTLILDIEDEHSYQKFWAPIASALGTNSTVYFSPDGIYYQINPETFKTPENDFLLDKQSITFLSNSKDLISNKPSSKNRKSIQKTSPVFVLGGNPSYYSGNQAGKVSALPGAEKEVLEIASLLKKHSLTAHVLTGNALTEDTVKSMQHHHVLHFATHGYFQETSYQNNSRPDHSLLNSGILFYRGGELLEKSENVNSHSGVLTAYEAASLNLSNTDLVVLSACETGRGAIINGEGVFGLQRSLLLAGADAVIMSLFKVQDDVTQAFMYHFYDEYIRSGDKRKAFALAKRKIKETNPSPLSWGAFLMIESNPKGTGTTVQAIH